MIKVKLEKSVEVVERKDLGLDSFPSNAQAAQRNWGTVLNEAYGLGYSYGGLISQQVGGDVFVYVVFNKIPNQGVSANIKPSAKTKSTKQVE